MCTCTVVELIYINRFYSLFHGYVVVNEPAAAAHEPAARAHETVAFNGTTALDDGIVALADAAAVLTSATDGPRLPHHGPCDYVDPRLVVFVFRPWVLHQFAPPVETVTCTDSNCSCTDHRRADVVALMSALSAPPTEVINHK